MANSWKIILNLEVIEHVIHRQDLFQQLSKRWNVPRAIVYLENGFIFSILFRSIEFPEERPVRRYHLHIFVQYNEGFPNRAHDAFRIYPGIMLHLLSLLSFSDVYECNNNAVNNILCDAIGQYPH